MECDQCHVQLVAILGTSLAFCPSCDRIIDVVKTVADEEVDE